MSTRPWERRGSADVLKCFEGATAPFGQQGERGTHVGPDDLRTAITSFLDTTPILSVLQSSNNSIYKRTGNTNGGEWAGPCPLCGGQDRLRVWPSPPEGRPRAWCRQCKEAGDALHWTVRLAGRNPRARGATAQSLRELGVAPPAADKQFSSPAHVEEATGMVRPPAPGDGESAGGSRAADKHVSTPPWVRVDGARAEILGRSRPGPHAADQHVSSPRPALSDPAIQPPPPNGRDPATAATESDPASERAPVALDEYGIRLDAFPPGALPLCELFKQLAAPHPRPAGIARPGDPPGSHSVGNRSGDDHVATPIERNPARCYLCDGGRYWRLRSGGPWVCERCHPPGPPDALIERAEVPDA